MAVRSPVPRSAITFAYSPFSDQPVSPQPQRAFGAHPSMSAGDKNGLLNPSPFHNAGLIEPPSAISESSVGTDFTDLDEVDERNEKTTAGEQQQHSQEVAVAKQKSPTEKSPDLKIETMGNKFPLHALMREEPQSVIHIPSGFGSFGDTPRQLPQQMRSPPRPSLSSARPMSQQSQNSNLSRSTRSSTTQDSRSQDSWPALDVDPTATPRQPSQGEAREMSSSTMSSNATVTTENNTESEVAQSQPSGTPVSPPPLSTSIPAAPDERGTPRAQTRSELAEGISRPGSSLASISELDDEGKDGESDSGDNLAPIRNATNFIHDPEIEINALKTALAECWTLCNTLASLSSIHRERLYKFSGKGDMHEYAWQACWKLCQNLYETRDEQTLSYVRPTLDLCREFCSALFEVRVRDNETADSVLRVSFELNNHLFNTHDRSLPETFRERTLDFYITLCHRLMKQKSKMAEESDNLLRACWSLAEMLFSLRQNRREGKRPDEELLGSAVQACWELCDLFREGWTQIRPDRGTPRPSQTTFSQAFAQAARTGLAESESNFAAPQSGGPRRVFPETPTTIFEDVGSANTFSPDDAVGFSSISVMGSQRQMQPQPRYESYPVSAVSVEPPSASTAESPMSATTFATDSSSVISATVPYPIRGRPASLAGSSLSHRSSNHPNTQAAANTTVPRSWSMASSTRSRSAAPSEAAVSVANTATTRTTRTTNTITRNNYASAIPQTQPEDPTLTLLKTLFVRAAVQTGRGYNRNSSDPNLNNLQQFVKNLPDHAFGNQSWQTSLLDNYKKAIINDPGFRHIPHHLTTVSGQKNAVGGPLEVARAVNGMVRSVYGFGWLRDLYRFVFGVFVEEVVQGLPVRQREDGFMMGSPVALQNVPTVSHQISRKLSRGGGSSRSGSVKGSPGPSASDKSSDLNPKTGSLARNGSQRSNESASLPETNSSA